MSFFCVFVCVCGFLSDSGEDQLIAMLAGVPGNFVCVCVCLGDLF